jgi:GMP synthase (glutamine-hydrolysing)
VADLAALHADPARVDLAWRLGIDAQVIDPALRVTEIRNFLAHRVKPTASARGRA